MSLGFTFDLINKLIRAYHLVVMAFKRRFFGMRCQTCQGENEAYLEHRSSYWARGAWKLPVCTNTRKKDPEINAYADLRNPPPLFGDLPDLSPEEGSPEGDWRMEGEILTSVDLGTSQDLPPLFGDRHDLYLEH